MRKILLTLARVTMVAGLLLGGLLACAKPTPAPTPSATPTPVATPPPPTPTPAAPVATPAPVAAPTPTPAPTMWPAPQWKLRVAQFTPPTEEPRWKAAFIFADQIKKKTMGRVELDIAPAGQLVPVGETPDALTRGSIDGAFHVDLYFAGKVPVWQWPLVPGYADVATVVKESRETRILGLEQAEGLKYNLVLVGGWGSDRSYLFLHKDKYLRTPADLKGTMLRGAGGITDLVLKDLGVGVVSMPSAEVYTSIQRGVVDGAISAVSAMYGMKMYEVAKYWTDVPVACYRILLVFSKATWDKLPPDVQSQIKEAVVAAESLATEMVVEWQKVLLAEVERAGVRLYEPDLKLWVDALQPLYEKNFFAKAGPLGEEVAAEAKKWQKAQK